MIISGITRLLKNHSPLLVVIAVALIIAIQNIDPTTIYSGWDNIHAEFDLGRYARQVFFGAWVEHQGLGAPAAQAQLSEVPRLPILFVLHTLLPANLVRYVFIFLMYLIGGVGMYWYLAKIWFKQNKTWLRNWLAALGGLFYLLHILTLQQFYISFEMFMVQFAFLPFLLLSLHKLANRTNSKSILLFMLVQLFLAPSAHSSTVFYLGVLFSLIYGFFLVVKTNPLKALRFSLLVGLLTFIANAYWLLPNLYYTLNNSSYVSDSRTNQLFAPDAVWSIREAGTLNNLTSGTHYLFSWRDYNFAENQFEFIFNEWLPHLNQLPVRVLMQLFGVLTLLGAFFVVAAKDKAAKRWAVLIVYLFCLSFIWIDLLPSNKLINQLYNSGTFREAFRNPFTKLSIIYSFVSILLFVQVIESLLKRLQRNGRKKISGKTWAAASLGLLAGAIVYVAWPSFQGRFISDKLEIQYPTEYQAMFDYLREQDPQLRILQLPQFSHASWEYYFWPALGTGNGYQGMGFYFFGFPQALLNRDSDRWVETADFFYHELKPALDTLDAGRFQEVLEKYRVDLVIVDETRVDPNRQRDYALDHQLAFDAGLTEVWRADFLTIYERQSEATAAEVFVPDQITKASANVDRVRADYLYQQQGNYLAVEETEAAIVYPLADLVAHRLTGLDFNEEAVGITRQIGQQKYQLTIPGWQGETYFTPTAVSYQEQTVRISFPEVKVTVGEASVTMPKLADFEFEVSSTHPSLLVFFNDVGVIVEENQVAYPILKIPVGQEVAVEYAPTPEQLAYLPSGEIDGSQLVETAVATLNPNWLAFTQQQMLTVEGPEELKITLRFPVFKVDLLQSPAINCAAGKQGSIATRPQANTVLYQADAFGVNCGGYVFEHLSSAYPYVMKLVGKNLQGRGSKFFVSYADRNIVPEDYFIRDDEFNAFIGLGKISDDPRDIFYLNWETRSFGKEDVNELTSIELAPFPLEQLAQLRLERIGVDLSAANQATLTFQNKYLDAVHAVGFTCQQAPCYVGLDQSYDDLWLAFKVGQVKLLPHFKLNNWANLWQVDGSGTVIIFYLPELISLLSMLGLAGWISVLLRRAHR